MTGSISACNFKTGSKPSALLKQELYDDDTILAHFVYVLGIKQFQLCSHMARNLVNDFFIKF